MRINIDIDLDDIRIENIGRLEEALLDIKKAKDLLAEKITREFEERGKTHGLSIHSQVSPGDHIDEMIGQIPYMRGNAEEIIKEWEKEATTPRYHYRVANFLEKTAEEIEEELNSIEGWEPFATLSDAIMIFRREREEG